MNGKDVFVYLIAAIEDGAEDIKAVKIGFTASLKKRHASLQHATYLELRYLCNWKAKGRKSARYIESMLHDRFLEKKIRGEWFCASVAPDAIQWGMSNMGIPEYIDADLSVIDFTADPMRDGIPSFGKPFGSKPLFPEEYAAEFE